MATIKYINQLGGAVGDFLIAPLTWESGGDGGEPADLTDMAIDADGTDAIYTYEVSAGKEAVIYDIRIILVDQGADNDRKFGDVTVLDDGSGCLLHLVDEDDEILFDFSGQETDSTNEFNANYHWGIYPNAVHALVTFTDGTPAAQTDSCPIRLDFSYLGGLSLFEGQKIKATIRADLTGLDTFRMLVRGILFNV